MKRNVGTSLRFFSLIGTGFFFRRFQNGFGAHAGYCHVDTGGFWGWGKATEA
jgi:hypothetical protein